MYEALKWLTKLKWQYNMGQNNTLYEFNETIWHNIKYTGSHVYTVFIIYTAITWNRKNTTSRQNHDILDRNCEYKMPYICNNI